MVGSKELGGNSDLLQLSSLGKVVESLTCDQIAVIIYQANIYEVSYPHYTKGSKAPRPAHWMCYPSSIGC